MDIGSAIQSTDRQVNNCCVRLPFKHGEKEENNGIYVQLKEKELNKINAQIKL